MKKLTIFILLFTITLFTYTINASELYNYTYKIYEGNHYDLDSGIWEDNDSWTTTGMITIKSNRLQFDATLFDHIQFFTKTNVYLGFINSQNVNYTDSDSFLTDINLEYTDDYAYVIVPAGTSKVVLSINTYSDTDVANGYNARDLWDYPYLDIENYAIPTYLVLNGDETASGVYSRENNGVTVVYDSNYNDTRHAKITLDGLSTTSSVGGQPHGLSMYLVSGLETPLDLDDKDYILTVNYSSGDGDIFYMNVTDEQDNNISYISQGAGFDDIDYIIFNGEDAYNITITAPPFQTYDNFEIMLDLHELDNGINSNYAYPNVFIDNAINNGYLYTQVIDDLTITYNIVTQEFILDGTPTDNTTIDLIDYYTLPENDQYYTKIYEVSGMSYAVENNIYINEWDNTSTIINAQAPTPVTSVLNTNLIKTANLTITKQLSSGEYNNYTFKLVTQPTAKLLTDGVFNELDRDITDLNGYSLREFFEDNNLIKNYDFSDGLNGWHFGANVTNMAVIDGQLHFTGGGNIGSTGNNWVRTSEIIIPQGSLNNEYYYNFYLEIYDKDMQFGNDYFIFFNSNQYDNYIGLVSGIGSPNDNNEKYITFGATNNVNVIIDNVYFIDKTTLGITADKETLDNLYNTYTQYDYDDYYNDLNYYPITYKEIDYVSFDIDHYNDYITQYNDYIEYRQTYNRFIDDNALQIINMYSDINTGTDDDNDTTTPIIDRIDDKLDEFNIGNIQGRQLIAYLIIIITIIMLALIKTQGLMIMFVGIILYLLFALLGWVQMWVIVLFAVALFILLIRGQSGGNGNG